MGAPLWSVLPCLSGVDAPGREALENFLFAAWDVSVDVGYLGTTFVSNVYPMDVPFVACILRRLFAVFLDALAGWVGKRFIQVPDGIIFHGMAYIFL